MPPVVVSEPIVKVGKFKASKIVVKESWNILKQDKEIMWFPIISSISVIGAFLVMSLLSFFLFFGGSFEMAQMESNKELSDIVFYSGLLIYYLVIFFIVNFFQAGLFMVVQARLSGQDMSFKQGIQGAKSHVGRIFVWSLISATVGVILQIIADKFKIAGRIVSWLLGSAWNILTFFSLPALVIGNLGIQDSFKESAAIIRKTWGETIIVNFGAGLFFAGLFFLGLIISVGLVVLIPSFKFLVFVVVVFVIFVLILSVISSTLNSIFKLVLFNFARTGVVPQGFSEDIVRNAVKSSSAR